MGSATPSPAQSKRLGPLVLDSLNTPKVTWPGISARMPSPTVIILHRAGRIPDTCTRLYFSMPACRKASSCDWALNRWRPTPLVKKTRVGIGGVHSCAIVNPCTFTQRTHDIIGAYATQRENQAR